MDAAHLATPGLGSTGVQLSPGPRDLLGPRPPQTEPGGAHPDPVAARSTKAPHCGAFVVPVATRGLAGGWVGYEPGMSFDDEPTRMSPRVPQPPAGQPTPPAGQPRVPHPPADARPPVAGAVPPGAVPPGVDPAVPWAQDPRLAVIEDRLSSLRTALWAFAAVSVVALGLAFWALLDDGGDDTGGGSGSSTASTRALRDRVSKLEDRIDDRATDGDVQDVSKQVAALSKRVDALPTTSTTPQDDGGDQVNPEAISALQDDVQQLQQQVQALQQAAAAAGADTAGGDDTTTTP